MRVAIVADGVSTEALRELAAACSSIGVPGPSVRCDGPEHWKVQTPPMQVQQWAIVASTLIRYEGAPVLEVLRGGRDTTRNGH